MFTQTLWLHAFWLIEKSAAQISNFGEHLLCTQHTSTKLGKGRKPGRLWLLGVCDLRGAKRHIWKETPIHATQNHQTFGHSEILFGEQLRAPHVGVSHMGRTDGLRGDYESELNLKT